MRNKFSLLAIIFVLNALFLRVPVYAQENLKSALKEVAEKIEDLAEVKEDDTLPYEERIRKEIQTRKEALLKIFELTLLEDEALKNKLNGIENLNEIQKQIRDILLIALKENENAYQEMRKRLDGADNLKEIKQLAVDFKNWRAFVHNPKTEKIISFALVFQEKNVLGITRNRLEKIKADLEKLEKMKIIQKEDTGNLLAEAIGNIEKAENLNKQAKDALFLLLAKELYPLDNAATSTELMAAAVSENEPPSVKSLVEESLKNIKEAYRIFIEISKVVKEKIGL